MKPENILKDAFKDRIRKLRWEYDMTQDEFAKFIYIPKRSLQNYENGLNLPNVIMAAQIAQRCEVSLDWLIGLTDIREES